MFVRWAAASAEDWLFPPSRHAIAKKMLSLTLSLSLFLFLFHTHTHSISLSFSFSSSLSRTHTLTLPPSHFWYCVLPAVKMIAPLSLFDGTHTQAHTQTVFPFSPSFYFKAHSFLKALTLNLLGYLSLSFSTRAYLFSFLWSYNLSLLIPLSLTHTHLHSLSLSQAPYHSVSPYFVWAFKMQKHETLGGLLRLNGHGSLSSFSEFPEIESK